MKFLWYLLLFHHTLHLLKAVKIGISRPDIMTTSTTSAPNITAEVTEISMSTSLLQMETTSNSVISTELSTASNEMLTTSMPSTKTAKTTKTLPTIKLKFTTPTTTTISKTTTTESTVLETVIESVKKNSESAETINSLGTNYCACNILSNICDINCCCDHDCSPNVLKVFDCYAVPTHPELRTRLEDFQYQHGLPSCKINDGWLCVFRSNVQEKRKSVPNLLADTSGLYKWPSLMLEAVQQDTVASGLKFYKFGEVLQLIDLDNMDIKNFELPYAFVNTHCNIKEPIRHLKNTRTRCEVGTLEALQQHQHELLTTISEYSLLQIPMHQILDAGNAAEQLLDIKLKRCIVNPASSKDECLATSISELEAEDYYWFNIEIVFKHNYTHLLDCEFKLKEHKLKAGISETAEYWQRFVVSFEFQNSSEIHHKVNNYENGPGEVEAISGALGYIQGEPIIMSYFVPYNDSIDIRHDNHVLSYFQPNATRLRKNHAFLLMSKRHELCYKKVLKDEYISFGINVLKQCKVRLENSTDLLKNPSERNFTIICAELQQLAMAQLVMSEKIQEIWISQLGKPLNDSGTKWTRLQWRNYDFAPIVGEYNLATQTFTCRNILLNVRYEFQVGSFMEQGVAHQNLVKHATLSYGPRHDLEFGLTEVLELPLSVSVMFYDFVHGSGTVIGAKYSLAHRVTIAVFSFSFIKLF